MARNELAPVTPGEMLSEEFLTPTHDGLKMARQNLKPEDSKRIKARRAA